MSLGDVISLCDRTGVAVKPWAEAGYRCWCVDVQHPMAGRRAGNVSFVYGDARAWCPPREAAEIVMVMAWPPCTDVAVSGARHFAAKGLRKLTDALDLFNACLHAAEWSRAPYLIENPVGVLSTYARRPDYLFDPADYAGYAADPAAEAYTKKTCLWTGGGFVMPDRRAVTPLLGSKMHLMPPSDRRGDLRSVTPEGFARAVYQANAPHLRQETEAA